MNQPPDDPIARALGALDRLHAAHPNPAEAAAWQDARTALSEAQGERFTFLVVVAAARKLIADLEGYEAAIEGEDLEYPRRARRCLHGRRAGSGAGPGARPCQCRGGAPPIER